MSHDLVSSVLQLRCSIQVGHKGAYLVDSVDLQRSHVQSIFLLGRSHEALRMFLGLAIFEGVVGAVGEMEVRLLRVSDLMQLVFGAGRIHLGGLGVRIVGSVHAIQALHNLAVLGYLVALGRVADDLRSCQLYRLLGHMAGLDLRNHARGVGFRGGSL